MPVNSGPRRIQRKRVKGWKMPTGAVYAGRPSRWANPFRVGKEATSRWEAVIMYRRALERRRLQVSSSDIRRRFRGVAFVACWCPEDEPCHVDVMIEVLER